MEASRKPTPEEQVRALYGEAETRTAEAFEQVVQRTSFAELLAQLTENVMALTKVARSLGDVTIRNLRLAGRRDIVDLARQLARNEDKLELVLQEVERLQDQLAEHDREAEHRAAEANGRARGELEPASRSGRRGGEGRSGGDAKAAGNAGGSRQSGD